MKNTRSTVGTVSRPAAKPRAAAASSRHGKGNDAQTRSAKRSPSTPPRGGAKAQKAGESPSRRPWIVLGSLVGFLAVTGTLLKVLAPPPLTPDATTSLFAVGQYQSIDRVFETPVAIGSTRWHSIYVHHSLTAGGDAHTLGQAAGGLADHFLIGNGNGLTDGAVQTGPRWSQQRPAGAVPGVEIQPDCITICIVGDLNRARPTPTQQARLVELVNALQHQLGIGADGVVLRSDDPSIAGVGSRFPASALRAQLAQ